MKKYKIIYGLIITALGLFGISNSFAAPIYLNNSNMSVEVGVGTSPGTFNNTFNSGATIEKVINAPSANAEEIHDQTSHTWFTADQIGGGLELIFNFGTEYNLNTLHFWNYTSEGYDVDNIDFTFFNSANTFVGNLSIAPEIGRASAIIAENIALFAPLNVQYVSAFLTGDNKQVDFQNIGFTAELSTTVPNPIPEPMTFFILAIGLLGMIKLGKLH